MRAILTYFSRRYRTGLMAFLLFAQSRLRITRRMYVMYVGRYRLAFIGDVSSGIYSFSGRKDSHLFKCKSFRNNLNERNDPWDLSEFMNFASYRILPEIIAKIKKNKMSFLTLITSCFFFIFNFYIIQTCAFCLYIQFFL